LYQYSDAYQYVTLDDFIFCLHAYARVLNNPEPEV